MKLAHSVAVTVLAIATNATPAKADISAIYESEHADEYEAVLDFAMTVEVDDSGNARVHTTGTSGYFLIRDGIAYRVYRGIDGPYAEKLEDLEATIKNAGQSGGIDLKLLEQFPGPDLKKTGKVKIGLWSGEGYAGRDHDEEFGPPELVISKDTSLAPIGSTFARLLNSDFGTLRALSLLGLFGTRIFSPKIRELFKEGTPIRMKALSISEVSLDPIEPSRFKLPERVLTKEETISREAPFEWPPVFGRQPKG